MSGELEVSFNSPQCGWMSIGLESGENEFHTTTAHAPHSNALAELLHSLKSMLKGNEYSHTLRWNRDPEEFDFILERNGDDASIQVFEYPTTERNQEWKELVFDHSGAALQIAEAFLETFQQLYDERDVDEFEENWHQEFPYTEFSELMEAVSAYGR